MEMKELRTTDTHLNYKKKGNYYDEKYLCYKMYKVLEK